MEIETLRNKEGYPILTFEFAKKYLTANNVTSIQNFEQKTYRLDYVTRQTFIKKAMELTKALKKCQNLVEIFKWLRNQRGMSNYNAIKHIVDAIFPGNKLTICHVLKHNNMEGDDDDNNNSNPYDISVEKLSRGYCNGIYLAILFDYGIFSHDDFIETELF